MAEQAERQDGESEGSETSEVVEESQGLPEIKTISVTYGRKMNLENFNSAHVEISAWADLDPEDDNADVVVGALWDWAKGQVKTQLQPLVDWKARKAEAAKSAMTENGNGAPAGPVRRSAPPAGQAPPPAASTPPAQARGRAPAQQGAKTGTAELQGIDVDAKGAVAFHVKGYRWPFKDARGAAVVVELFDQALGWTEEHFAPGSLYDEAIDGYMVEWEKPDKYYNVVRVYLP